MPRHLPNCPKTPASSLTSRSAVTAGSSSGSTPPPGTIQLSGLRLDVTNNTYDDIMCYIKVPTYIQTLERNIVIAVKIIVTAIMKWINTNCHLLAYLILEIVFDADTCSSTSITFWIVNTDWIWFFLDHDRLLKLQNYAINSYLSDGQIGQSVRLHCFNVVWSRHIIDIELISEILFIT